MIESHTEEIRERLHAAHEAAAAELADIVVAGIREDISDAFPPASDPGTPPHSRTGALLRGVGQETAREGGKINSTISSGREGGDPSVPVYLERGTSRMRARPYMEPAKDEWASKALGLLPDLIRAHL